MRGLGVIRSRVVVSIGSGALVGLALLCRTTVATAEDSLPAPLVALAQSADVIVSGECASERSAWDDGASVITTTIEFRPHRFYKGDLARSLTIKTLGGRVGDDSMEASHGASLAAGQQVLLFLKRSEFGAYFVVAGGESGKIEIDGAAPFTGPPAIGTRSELVRLLTRGQGS